MSNYNSSHTGAELDEAIGRVIDGGSVKVQVDTNTRDITDLKGRMTTVEGVMTDTAEQLRDVENAVGLPYNVTSEPVNGQGTSSLVDVYLVDGEGNRIPLPPEGTVCHIVIHATGATYAPTTNGNFINLYVRDASNNTIIISRTLGTSGMVIANDIEVDYTTTADSAGRDLILTSHARTTDELWVSYYTDNTDENSILARLNELERTSVPIFDADGFSDSDLDITDENGNVLVRFSDGGIKTKNFDSAEFSGDLYQNKYNGERIFLERYSFAIGFFTPQDIPSGHSRQGMDIYDGKAFMLLDTGICCIIDLSTNSLVDYFNLASYGAENHANTMNFGSAIPNGSEFPLMYITQAKVGASNAWTCSVEKVIKINDSYSSEQIQTITLDISGFAAKGYTPAWSVPTWLIDKERGYLWTFGALKRTTTSVTQSFSDNLYIAHQFNIPDTSTANVTLTADDVLKECIFPFDAYVTQGGTMMDGKIYYCFGFGGTGIDHSKIRVYDTDLVGISSGIDLMSHVAEECEDLAIYDKKLYMNSNSSKIYILKF